MLSCITLALEANGCDIQTVESMRTPEGLHVLAQAFERHGAAQCGFCTPGMIMRAVELLGKNPNPTEDEIRTGISGNLCRCTGYVNIVKSVQYAAEKMKAEVA